MPQHTRVADARSEIEEFEEEIQPTIWYKDVSTGDAVDPGDIVKIRSVDGIDRNFKRPPKLTPAEEAEAANYLRSLLENSQARFPTLA